MVQIRLLKPWLFNKVGGLLLVGAGVADVLLRNGSAELAEAPKAAPPKRTKK